MELTAENQHEIVIWSKGREKSAADSQNETVYTKLKSTAILSVKYLFIGCYIFPERLFC